MKLLGLVSIVLVFLLIHLMQMEIIHLVKKSGTNNILYTIYSCGCDAAANSCNAQSNVIVPLEASNLGKLMNEFIIYIIGIFLLINKCSSL